MSQKTPPKAAGFPLSLSAFSEKPGQRRASRSHATTTATPQTATRNAAWDLSRTKLQKPEPVSLERSVPAVSGTHRAHTTPLVSDSVRRAMIARLVQQGVQDSLVLAAMEYVPRHSFIESALVAQAYIDASLPIGYQQTISQPYIVARMIEVMRANDRNGRLDRVLEIGTGCGYQAAVLARVSTEVYSIERIKPLHELAKSNLRPMRIPNIRLHYGDGMLGLPQVAPFDGIILAAAGMEVPQSLLLQLAIGGRLVAPVGGSKQVLELIVRTAPSEWHREHLEDCHFVPLKSGTA
ncbi:MAG: protein-L-isoaspartate(D-aspartate) O-methyltransferase [Herbaspirillum sp.]